MNHSVSPLPREEEVQSKIRKIRAFGRNARTVCAVLLGLGLFASIALLLVLIRSPAPPPASGGVGIYGILLSPGSPLVLKMLSLLCAGVGLGVMISALLQLYRLFGNLAAGAIYTSENVRHVRCVGLLVLLSAVLGIVLPATIVVANSLLDAPMSIDPVRVNPSLDGPLSSFAAAGLILLVSWIMDVGLYEKQHADALRSDADLVI